MAYSDRIDAPSTPTSAVARTPVEAEVERRMRPGWAAAAAAAGGLVLIVSLLFEWYSYPSARAREAVTGWQVFSAADILLAALAAIVILAAVFPTRIRVLRHVAGLAMGLAGIAALALVAARLAFPPGPPAVLGALGISFEASRLGGVFVAFSGAVVMAVSGVVIASGVMLGGVSSAFERLNRDL